MEHAIHFETTIERGIIRIPEQYIKTIPAAVRVTLVPLNGSRMKMASKGRPGALSPGDFSALQIDTRNWRFNREEANERR